MKKNILLLVALAAVLSTARANYFDEIKGDLDGPVDGPAPKFVALYFSAHWCPPCRLFTPKLVEWYKEFKAKHPEFELVFVSGDESKAAMQAYVKETGMPWALAAFDKVDAEVFRKYASSGIPYLVLIGEDGQALTAKPGNDWKSPAEVLPEIEKIVGG
jgi:nucleoredoxin